VRSLAAHAWSATATIAAPGLLLMLRRRVLRGKEIESRLGERFGWSAEPRPPGDLLWLHAASVGETVSALPLLPLLPPGLHVLFTTGTVTSARLLQSRLAATGGASWATCVIHRFVPLDVPAWAAAFLDHWRPEAACFIESEIWPNLLAACSKRGVRLGLINARMSARSARRWRLAGAFIAELLGSFTWIAAQSEADAARLRALGARNVTAPGDLKLAADPLPVDEAELIRLKTRLAGRPVWLAASTHPGEEALAASVHATLRPRFPNLLTILVPRHPERGEAVARLLGGAPRRSKGEDPGDFWIGDTLGEMGLFYRLSRIVFLGKSFTPGGGQNPWEPARLGCAVAVGPNTANFDEAVANLSATGGLAIVQNEAALSAWVGGMLAEPERCQACGEAALNAAASAGGLPRHFASLIEDLLK
jgi:3-deoxy-D-manno-octulosonic-acid transferase